VAPDLPGDDDSAGLNEYADTVVEAVGDRKHLVVVGQSFGAFTATLVADRLPVDVLVLVAGMIPSPGEAPGDWWANTGYRNAVTEQAARDGGKTGNEDPYVSFYHDVPRKLAEEAMSKERAHPSEASMASPWPLDAWPSVPTKFVLCTEDRFFPPDFFRRLVAERLNITPVSESTRPVRHARACQKRRKTSRCVARTGNVSEMCPRVLGIGNSTVPICRHLAQAL
jgi:pimeloyl-ACP methyl ester carboxylesterase